jgi:hypothetical protein
LYWAVYRRYLRISCDKIFILVNGCSTPTGWQLRGHYLDSGLGHSDDVTMYFEVKSVGFAGKRGLVSRTASAVGSVRIDFELDCDGPCVFTMYEVRATP